MPGRQPGAAAAGVGVAVLLVALCSCSSGSQAALYSNTATESLCLPAPHHDVVTDAQDTLRRQGQSPVTLESVTLENARNLSVVGPVLLPSSAGTPLIGGPWPPPAPGNSFAPVVWTDRIGRHEVVGANVREVIVVFGVSVVAGSPSGHASGTRIEFLQSGRREIVVTRTALTVVDGPSCAG